MAKTEFKAAWKALKASTTPEQLARPTTQMNIRDDPPERTATNKGTAPGQGLGLQVRVGSLMSRLVDEQKFGAK